MVAKRAAKRIQKLVRVHRARKRDANAAKFQALWRRYMTRCVCERERGHLDVIHISTLTTAATKYFYANGICFTHDKDRPLGLVMGVYSNRVPRRVPPPEYPSLHVATPNTAMPYTPWSISCLCRNIKQQAHQWVGDSWDCHDISYDSRCTRSPIWKLGKQTLDFKLGCTHTTYVFYDLLSAYFSIFRVGRCRSCHCLRRLDEIPCMTTNNSARCCFCVTALFFIPVSSTQLDLPSLCCRSMFLHHLRLRHAAIGFQLLWRGYYVRTRYRVKEKVSSAFTVPSGGIK